LGKIFHQPNLAETACWDFEENSQIFDEDFLLAASTFFRSTIHSGMRIGIIESELLERQS
jgi:hypothetical protein